MRYSAHEGVFQDVRERSVADVVHQYGCLHGLGFGVEDEDAFLLERLYGFAHQMERSQGMLETCVLSTRIDHIRQTELLDAAKAVEGGMIDDIKQQSAWYADEAKYGIIDDFQGYTVLWKCYCADFSSRSTTICC